MSPDKQKKGYVIVRWIWEFNGKKILYFLNYWKESDWKESDWKEGIR